MAKDTGFRLVDSNLQFKIFMAEVFKDKEETMQDFMDYIFSVYCEDDMTVHMRPGGYAFIMRHVKVKYGEDTKKSSK